MIVIINVVLYDYEVDILKKLLQFFAISVRGFFFRSSASNLFFSRRNPKKFDLVSKSDLLSEQFRTFLHKYAKFSRSQYGQDLFVIYMILFHCTRDLGKNPVRYYVEFGATDGVSLSNSFMLEKYFGWRGILSEPARKWHKHLERNRKAIIDQSCVYSETGINLNFFEAKVGSLSTIDGFQESDFHLRGLSSAEYLVQSISLCDLLDKHSAPKYIHYLSIDTEGSEYEILRVFDFNFRDIGLITIEHNFRDSRELICELLEKHGFMRVLVGYSKCDDWYVNRKYFEIPIF